MFRSNDSLCEMDTAKKMKIREQGRIRENDTLSHLSVTNHA